jgi:hypothetical protein
MVTKSIWPPNQGQPLVGKYFGSRPEYLGRTNMSPPMTIDSGQGARPGGEHVWNVSKLARWVCRFGGLEHSVIRIRPTRGTGHATSFASAKSDGNGGNGCNTPTFVSQEERNKLK